jgi:hypothetical protein
VSHPMKTLAPIAALLAALIARADGADESPAPLKSPTFKVPKGWKAEKVGPFATARFRIGEGKKAAGVVITAVTGEGGGIAPNVNRWRQQVGLGQLEDEDARKAVRPVKIGGLKGHLFDATGKDKDDEPAQRVVVAFVKHGDHTWYFRMTGPAAVVKGQKAAFDQFLKSVRFEGAKKE